MKEIIKTQKPSRVIAIAVLLITFNSCTDDVTLDDPNNLTQDNFFESLSQIEAAANGTYNQLQSRGLYKRFGYILGDAFSDEVNSSNDPNFRTPFVFGLLPSTESVELYWASCYRGISTCNFLIDGEQTMRENLENGGVDFTEADINDALGQAYFLRGLYYYLLVKRYGGVPLVTTTTEVVEAPRSTLEETYAQIISDFTLAAQNLYPKGQTEIGRAAQGAAFGMLGKTYLHRQMYGEAKAALDQVTGYSLLPLADYRNNFNESGEYNDESMFEVAFSSDAGDRDGSEWGTDGQGLEEVTFHAQEYTGWGNFLPSDKLINEFEVDDPRSTIAVLQDGDPYGPNNEFTRSGGKVWYKFSNLYEEEFIPSEFSGINARILRYADVVLMKAEVENELGNASAAIGYLNELRNRLGLPEYGSAEMDARGYPVSSQAEIFEAIVHERWVELCGEQHRFDDLIRWGRDASEINVDDAGDSRGYNSSIHHVIPIPQTEIDNNPNINQEDQNEGWR